MFPTVGRKLLLAFFLVVMMTVMLSGVGACVLLRNEQINGARERTGLLVLPTASEVNGLLKSGAGPEDIERYLVERSRDWRVRFLLLDRDNQVVVDTARRLEGSVFDVQPDNGKTKNFGNLPGFSFVNYEDSGQSRTVFYPNQKIVVEVQFVAREYRLMMDVPDSSFTGAWIDLLPRLAIAALAALIIATIVSYGLTQSIARPVARVTRASEGMARGDYDQSIPVTGQDEIARLATSFNAMAQQVRHSHKMMRDLLANVAHELKTPLTSIQGFSQALIEGAATTPEDQSRAARVINEEGERMRVLVEDLLYLSQLESGQLRMEMAPVDIRHLLRNAVERLDWQAHETGRTLRLAIAPDVPLVTGDERRLEQVLANLLDNALRHTPSGGTISVRGERDADSVTMVVHNEGSYIPPDVLNRIFERFYRADQARTRDGRHGGLGLSIAKEIVTAHGGELTASSDEATGTEFRVRLPLPGASAPTNDGRLRRDDQKPRRLRLRGDAA